MPETSSGSSSAVTTAEKTRSGRSRMLVGVGIRYLRSSCRRKTNDRMAALATTPTSAGAHVSARNCSGPPSKDLAASKLVRFETGRKRDAVFASQTVASANGMGDTPTWTASSTTTGVTSTAVVSRERNAVLTTASRSTSIHSSQSRPRPSFASRSASAEKTPASLASSATIVMPTTNASTGRTRSPSSSRSGAGSTPMAATTTAATTSTAVAMMGATRDAREAGEAAMAEQV